MSDHPFFMIRRPMSRRRRRSFVAPFLAGLLWLPLCALGETYLDAIQVEAEKLGEENAAQAPGDTGPAAEDPQAAFERELEQRYRGSYLFYKKLPAKSQEEVYLEYQAGAPIREVRKTIMNRFLHSR